MAQQHIIMNMPDGKGGMKKVKMKAGEAMKLRQKRNLAATNAMIPSNLRPLVDAGAIHGAVSSSINAANAPIIAAQGDAQRQLGQNLQAGQALAAQTRLHEQSMLQGAQQRTQGFMQTGAQALAAAQASDSRSAEAMAAMLGNALNPQAAAVADAGVQAGQAVRFADNTGNTWANVLGSQAQQDFFQRAGAINQMQEAGFERDQRSRLADVLSQLKAAVAANSAKRGEMTRQFAQEDFTLASAFASSQAEHELEQAKLANDRYGLDTDRLNVVSDATNDANKIAASAGTALSKQQAKDVTGVRKQLDAMMKKLRTPISVTSMKDENGNKLDKPRTTTRMPSSADVFGAGRGPWREAFDRLRADAGLSTAQAALRATAWFGDLSFGKSTPLKIRNLLHNRNVPPKIQQQIVDQYFGKGAYAKVMKGTVPATTAGNGQITRPISTGGVEVINPNVTDGGGSTSR